MMMMIIITSLPDEITVAGRLSSEMVGVRRQIVIAIADEPRTRQSFNRPLSGCDKSGGVSD